MTLEEAAGIVTLIFFNYPDTSKGMSDQARIAYTRQWHQFFAEDDARLVEAAVRSFILGSTERFAPNVGQIREQMRKMTVQAGLSEAEAWGLVKNALRNGSYGYTEEYAKLPKLVQRCVGSATQIREWAQMDADQVDSVVASNFQRSYRAVAKQEEEYQRLPAGFRQEMGKLTGQIFKPMLEERRAVTDRPYTQGKEGYDGDE